MDELIIPLPNGGSLRCGAGEEYAYGGYLRICDYFGNEILYWDVAEWEAEGEGESVIGAVFAASLKSLDELKEGRKLVGERNGSSRLTPVLISQGRNHASTKRHDLRL